MLTRFISTLMLYDALYTGNEKKKNKRRRKLRNVWNADNLEKLIFVRVRYIAVHISHCVSVIHIYQNLFIKTMWGDFSRDEIKNLTDIRCIYLFKDLTQSLTFIQNFHRKISSSIFFFFFHGNARFSFRQRDSSSRSDRFRCMYRNAD